MLTKATSIAGRHMQQLAIDRTDWAVSAKQFKRRGDKRYVGICLNQCKVNKARQRDWANRIITGLALPKEK